MSVVHSRLVGYDDFNYAERFCLDLAMQIMLWRGNYASAKLWWRLLPVIARYRSLDMPKFFQGDAGLAGPKFLHLLEQEEFLYTMRIKSKAALQRIGQLPLAEASE